METFDLRQRCGLYLTFYGDGDTRERGMALLRLKKLYRAAGLPLRRPELPDHLPVMLEFAAAAPRATASVLREHRAALELVRAQPARARQPVRARARRGLPDRRRALGRRPGARRRSPPPGPPEELVGLEPFAPPEVMPSAEARR